MMMRPVASPKGTNGATDEELLHAFYAGDDVALERLVERHEELLAEVARLLLEGRTGSPVQVLHEWDR